MLNSLLQGIIAAGIPMGLTNLENTCYMNASLQVIEIQIGVHINQLGAIFPFAGQEAESLKIERMVL
jgi:hypothetical protein